MHQLRHGMQLRHRRVQELEGRDPALIDLPFALPSIPLLSPLLDPILSPIIAGKPKTSTTPSHTTTPTQDPAPPPTTTATPPASNPSPTSPSDPNTGSGNPPPGNSSNSNGNGGNTATSGNTVTNAVPTVTPGSSPTVTDSSSDPSATTPTDPSSGDGSQSENGNGSSSTLSVVINAGGGQAFVSSTDSSHGAQETQANGNGDSNSGNSSGSQLSGRLTGTITGSYPGSTAGTRGASPSDPPGTLDATSTQSKMSTGIIVAICGLVFVLLLMLALCCFRRRAIAARMRRRKTWVARGAVNEKDYSDKEVSGTRSARSSFATTFDRGQMLVTPAPLFDVNVHVEQLTQVWPADLSGSDIAVPPTTHSVPSASSPTIRTTDRSSIHSSSSSGSRPSSQTGQYLVAVPPVAASESSPYSLDFPSPFSVRPFSPSETFAFPKPPHDDAQSRAASEMLSGSIMSSKRGSAFFTAEEGSPSTPVPESENPFADFTEMVRPPSVSTANSVPHHFSPIETIRRPFIPSMDDELSVAPGDEVRILKRFDDGWAVAEKVGASQQGLIPIDCLRAVEEDLPAFLAKKRISSYRARSSIVTRASVISGVSGVGAAL